MKYYLAKFETFDYFDPVTKLFFPVFFSGRKAEIKKTNVGDFVCLGKDESGGSQIRQFLVRLILWQCHSLCFVSYQHFIVFGQGSG